MALSPTCLAIFTSILFLAGAADLQAAESDGVITVDRSDFSRIDLSYSADQVETRSIGVGKERFCLLSLGSYGYTRKVGAPQLPVVREFIEIPRGADYELVLSDLEFNETSLSAMGLEGAIVPAQEPRPKERSARPFVLDEALYATDAFVLAETARLGEEVIARGRRLVVLELFPVDYNPATGAVRILKSATISLALTGADETATRETLQKRSSARFDSLINRVVVNAGVFEKPILSRPHKGSSRAPAYLIVVAASLAGNANLQLLATLRSAEGFDVTLVDTNTTGSTATDIKNYITNMYNTQDLEYFVLVGDTNTIPNWVGQGSSSPATDLNYACVEGSDYIPDVARGRLSVRTSTELDNLCAKIVGMAGQEVKKAVFMAGYDNYNISEGTHNYCIANFLDPQGWQSDKLYQVTYGATTQDVKDSFNAAVRSGVFRATGPPRRGPTALPSPRAMCGAW